MIIQKNDSNDNIITLYTYIYIMDELLELLILTCFFHIFYKVA